MSPALRVDCNKKVTYGDKTVTFGGACVISTSGVFVHHRFRAKRKPLERFSGLLPESEGQNLALTVLCVPDSLRFPMQTPAAR